MRVWVRMRVHVRGWAAIAGGLAYVRVCGRRACERARSMHV